jgi:hypothetical protein
VFDLPIPLLLLVLGTAGPAPVSGRCVEARTASVFAGACHYGAEATTGGREAVIAWRFDGGTRSGVDLAGLGAVAAIAGDANLAESGTARRSVLLVSDRATPAQRRSVLDLVESEYASVLGRVLEERAVPLEIAFAGEAYRVVCGGSVDRSTSATPTIELAGALLPDRACCKMPYAVWYRPLAPMSGALVGENLAFRSTERALGEVWDRPDENAAFVGVFEIR